MNDCEDDKQAEVNNLSFDPAEPEWHAVQSFLTAADALAAAGRHAEAEWRFRQALKQAEMTMGPESRGVKRVLLAQMAFYLELDRLDEAAAIGEQIAALPKVLNSRRRPIPSLLKRSRASSEENTQKPLEATPRSEIYVGHMPAEVRRACQILHISDDELTEEYVQKCWKKEVVSAQAHPDLGGEVEMSVLLNNARDTIIQWLESRAPKLGKLFDSRSIKP
ncbi:MAG TPA: hypothetical protein V6C72_08870 [Chroococcales cyanobacterium]